MSEEPFSRGLAHLVTWGQILPFYHPRGTPIVSHLLYADDVLIFLNGGANNLTKLMTFIHAYEGLSGQEINPTKSNFYVSDSFPVARATHTHTLIGFQRGT
ncbi:hypothetical protein PSY31_22450, partial [Shigella flexneri]|nr:hypothetical protein [Shigella flexneri]